MKKLKILFIGSKSAHNTKVLNIIKEYYNVLVLSNSAIENYDGKVIKIKKGYFSKIFQLKKILKEFNPDYIHVNNLSLLHIFYSFFLKKYKSIITTWGSDILIFPHKSFFHKLLVKKALYNFWKISTNEALEMQINLKLLGVNLNKIYLLNFGVSKYIEFADFKEKENIILSPRSHRDLYNINLVIKSFANFVKNTNKDWELVLTGREHPINTPKFKKLVKKFGIENKVKFCGFVDEKTNSEYFKKSKIVVSIPQSDAKSVSVMEAISSNCIVFVSNLPSNKELIIDKVNGFIVDYNKLIDFSIYKQVDIDLMTKVNFILKDNYSFENVKEKFLNLYKG